MRRWYARVRWSPLDVMDLAESRGIRLSKKRASEILMEIDSGLWGAMIEAGWEVIEARLLEEEGKEEEHAV